MKYQPSKLTEELIDELYNHLKQGLPVRYTCDLLCITQPSFSNWMRQGEADVNSGNFETLHATLFIAIKKGQAEFVSESLTDIRSGRPGWQGSAWVLERTRQDFMPRQEINAGEDGKVQVILGGKLKEIKKGTVTDTGEIK